MLIFDKHACRQHGSLLNAVLYSAEANFDTVSALAHCLQGESSAELHIALITAVKDDKFQSALDLVLWGADITCEEQGPSAWKVAESLGKHQFLQFFKDYDNWVSTASGSQKPDRFTWRSSRTFR